MLSTLDDAATLQQRARRQLVLATALSAGVLSPLVVLAVLSLTRMGSPRGLEELALYVGWGAVLGALLGSAVVHRALRRAPPTAGRVVGWSIAAGVAYPACLFAPAAVVTLPWRSLDDAMAVVLLGPLVVTLFGAIFSIPAGATFGAVFWSGVHLAHARVARPAHDVVAHARACGVAMLLAATCVALALAACLEGIYCQTLFYTLLPSLDVVPPEGTDAAWTRFLVLPSPLVLGALVLSLVSYLERRRIARTASAILAGTHPLWIADGPLDSDALDGALPLRESDRRPLRQVAIRSRQDRGPYRGGGAALASIRSR